jgi:hypothetical protein
MQLRSRQGALWFGLPFAALLLLGICLYPDYSVGIDEYTETAMLYQNWHLITERYLRGDFSKPYQYITHNTLHYGTLFNLAALPFQLLVADGPVTRSLAAYEIKHLITFFFSALSYAAIAFALWRTTRSKLAMIVAIAALALQPYYFGISLFYPKDPPFAGAYTLCSVACALYVGWLLRAMNALAQGDAGIRRKTWRYTAALGLLLGFFACIRIGALALPLYLMAVIACVLIRARFWRHPPLIRAALQSAAVMMLACFLPIWLLHAAAWPNPFVWLWDSISYLSHHPNRFGTRAAGQWINSLDTPRWYLPMWFYAQTPLLWLPAAGFGLAMIARDWKRLNATARLLIVFLLLQLLFLPLFAILAHSNLSAGLREFIFLLPPFAFLVGYGFLRLLQQRGKVSAIIAGVYLGYACLVAGDMYALHPYENEYFNEAEIATANDRWMIDINLTSARETALWLSANAIKGSFIIANYDGYMRPYLRPDLVAITPEAAKNVLRPVYAVASAGRTQQINWHKDCPVMQPIGRHLRFGTVWVAMIRKCR